MSSYRISTKPFTTPLGDTVTVVRDYERTPLGVRFVGRADHGRGARRATKHATQ